MSYPRRSHIHKSTSVLISTIVKGGRKRFAMRSHSTGKLGRTEQFIVFQTVRLTKILNQNVNKEKSMSVSQRVF